MTFATPAFNSSAPTFCATPFLVFTGAITLSDDHVTSEPDEYLSFNFPPSSSRNTNHKEL
jgi:hypothetical protein